jgi:hypothetical protein
MKLRVYDPAVCWVQGRPSTLNPELCSMQGSMHGGAAPLVARAPSGLAEEPSSGTSFDQWFGRVSRLHTSISKGDLLLHYYSQA